jgi:uncharacterized protein YkwD
MKFVGALALLGILLGGCGSTVSAPVSNPSLTSEENDFLKLLNTMRSQSGLDPLTVDSSLQVAAAHHSDYMASKTLLTHSEPKPNGSSSQRISNSGGTFTATAENVAISEADASATFDLWYGSEAHRANMLSDKYQYIGISRSGTYWTADFGGK